MVIAKMDGTENEHPEIEAQVRRCGGGWGGMVRRGSVTVCGGDGCLCSSALRCSPSAGRNGRSVPFLTLSPSTPYTQGYPTLIFFPAEEGAAPVPYEGERTLAVSREER